MSCLSMLYILTQVEKRTHRVGGQSRRELMHLYRCRGAFKGWAASYEPLLCARHLLMKPSHTHCTLEPLLQQLQYFAEGGFAWLSTTSAILCFQRRPYSLPIAAAFPRHIIATFIINKSQVICVISDYTLGDKTYYGSKKDGSGKVKLSLEHQEETFADKEGYYKDRTSMWRQRSRG